MILPVKYPNPYFVNLSISVVMIEIIFINNISEKIIEM